MRWLRGTLEAARQAALRLVRSRGFALLLVLCVVGAVGFWLVAREAAPEVPGDEFFGTVTYIVFFLVGLPFAVLYFGVTAVHGDIEDRSATYVFVRPVHRSSLLCGRWLAVVGVGAALAAAEIGLMWALFAFTDLPWSRGLRPEPEMLGAFVAAAAMAVAAYAAVGACFGALFKRPLVTGVAFVIGWELLVSYTPPQAGVRGLTVADPVRRWLLQELRLPRRSDLHDILSGGLDASWLGEQAGLADPVRSLLWFTAVMLGVGVWIYGRREYESRPRE